MRNFENSTSFQQPVTDEDFQIGYTDTGRILGSYLSDGVYARLIIFSYELNSREKNAVFELVLGYLAG